MQFIQAKRLNNKLCVRDNRPFAIDMVRFINEGFLLVLSDEEGKKRELTYNSLDWFREDFDVIDGTKGLKEFERFYQY